MAGSIAEPQWQEATAAIRSARTIFLVAHILPDGDAVGTLLGISETLRAMGKQVCGVIDGGVPGNLKFLPQSDTINAEVSVGEFDLMIAVDCSDIVRLGVAGAYGDDHSRQVINLDHHATNTQYGDINIIVTEAVAAAEVAFDLITYLGLEVSYEAAFALLTGLVTDSQGFRINATNSRTLEIAQALMQKGAPLSLIMANTLNRRPYEDVELWKLVLPSVSIDAGLISATITQEDIARSGLETTSDGGLVSHLVNVDQAKVSVVFKELESNEVEVGFRSKPGFDVASLAYQLGGGGHKQASGCTLAGSLDSARKRVLPLAHLAIATGTAALE